MAHYVNVRGEKSRCAIMWQPWSENQAGAVYEYLEQEMIGYAIRLSANAVLQREIAHLLVRPADWSSRRPIVSYYDFTYQAQSWSISRRVVAKVEWHQGELFPR